MHVGYTTPTRVSIHFIDVQMSREAHLHMSIKCIETLVAMVKPTCILANQSCNYNKPYAILSNFSGTHFVRPSFLQHKCGLFKGVASHEGLK